MLFLLFILLLSSRIIEAHYLIPRETPNDPNGDKVVLEHFAKDGLCFKYLDLNHRNPDKALAPCKTFCEAKNPGGEPTSYSCVGPGVPEEELDPSTISFDDDGFKYTYGECECSLPILEDIVGIVIGALPYISNVLCAGFIQTFQIIADTATLIIPGAGEVVAAAKVAVNVAKTFAENDLGSEAFGNWIGDTCDLPGGDFKYFSVFDALLSAPDSMGISLGCLRKDKKGCKPLDPKPDPKPDEKPEIPADKQKDNPETTAPPIPPKSEEIPTSTPTPPPNSEDLPMSTQIPPPSSDDLPVSTQTFPPSSEEVPVSTQPLPTESGDISASTAQPLPPQSEDIPMSTIQSLPSKSEDVPVSTDQPILSKSDGIPMTTSQLMPTRSEDSSATGIQTQTSQYEDEPTVAQSLPPESQTPETTLRTEVSTADGSLATSREVTKTDSKTDSQSFATTSSAVACKIGKRASPDTRVGMLGEDEKSEECANQATTIHITKTSSVIGWYTTLVPKTCSSQYKQACYHYRSVMSVHTNTPDMVRWTCQETDSSKDGKATAAWGATAITKIGNQQQHWWPWANGFIPRTAAKGCERDEWPPRNFWPGEAVASAKGMVQRVRLLEWEDNGGAGQIWKGFCNVNAAVSTHVISKNVKTNSYIKSAYISTIGVPKVVKDIGKDKTVTIVSSVSINTARAVFSFVDWDGLPVETKWHGLRENPCWPSALAPEDPGWALLTNDEFYKTQHTTLAQYTARYRGYPDVAVLQNALTGPRNTPPYPFVQIPLGSLKKQNIPNNYFGVLPGIPLRPIRKRSLSGTNSTEDFLALQMAEHNAESDITDDEIGTYDDEELDEWMDEYMELTRRKEAEAASRTKPFETEALPTPAGQGDPTPVPVIRGRTLAVAGLPEVTKLASL